MNPLVMRFQEPMKLGRERSGKNLHLVGLATRDREVAIVLRTTYRQMRSAGLSRQGARNVIGRLGTMMGVFALQLVGSIDGEEFPVTEMPEHIAAGLLNVEEEG